MKEPGFRCAINRYYFACIRENGNPDSDNAIKSNYFGYTSENEGKKTPEIRELFFELKFKMMFIILL